jgi:hypothetical protein
MIQTILAVAAGSTIVIGTIAIWIMLGFYSIRILNSFKGGVLSKGWKYVCIAVPFLIFGQFSTGLGDSSSIAMMQVEILKTIGVSLSAIGGLMIVIGFRTQYNAWHPKGLKMEGSSVPEAAAQQATA